MGDQRWQMIMAICNRFELGIDYFYFVTIVDDGIYEMLF